MSEPVDFALKPGAQKGDSAFLLNRGRDRLAFDSFPGRAVALAFVGSATGPDMDAALRTLAANRRLVDDGRAAFFVVVSEFGLNRAERARGAVPAEFAFCGTARAWLAPLASRGPGSSSIRCCA